MILTSYPAFSRGVEMARIPKGAVASMLEKEATKKTIFFDDFTGMPFSVASFPPLLFLAMGSGRASRNSILGVWLFRPRSFWPQHLGRSIQKVPTRLARVVSKLSSFCKIRANVAIDSLLNPV